MSLSSATIIGKLRHWIAPSRILRESRILDELSWDALSEGRIHPGRAPEVRPPLCAVRPQGTDEVQQIVRFANQECIALVPFGGGSGLMGGALSLRPCITVDLRGLSRILEMDTSGRAVHVQAGVVLESLNQDLDKAGFILGHDPWTVPVATVGGAISTNSVGYRAAVYGSMGEQVLGLQAVLPSGELLQTRAVSKHSAGLNLNALLIGAEGCFGIITEATVRIFPKPEAREFLSFKFSSFETGYEVIRRLSEARLRPAMLDFGDDADKAASGALLYLIFEGPKELVAAEQTLATRLCLVGGGQPLGPAGPEQFWLARHDIARRFVRNRRERRDRGRDGVYRDWIHVALPASKVIAYKHRAEEMVNRRGVRLKESGLWVQPELFSMRLEAEKSSAMPDARLVLEETVEELLRLAQQFGGSMEYTHGVGIKLAPLMAAEHGYGLEVMRQIKRTLDPNNILNPGKLGL